MDGFLKEMASLFFELGKAEGFNALVIVDEIQKSYDDHARELLKTNLSTQQEETIPEYCDRLGCTEKVLADWIIEKERGIKDKTKLPGDRKPPQPPPLRTIKIKYFPDTFKDIITDLKNTLTKVGNLQSYEEDKKVDVYCPNCSKESQPSINKDQACICCLELF